MRGCLAFAEHQINSRKTFFACSTQKSHRLGHREEAQHNGNESVPFRSDHAYALLPMKPN